MSGILLQAGCCCAGGMQVNPPISCANCGDQDPIGQRAVAKLSLQGASGKIHYIAASGTPWAISWSEYDIDLSNINGTYYCSADKYFPCLWDSIPLSILQCETQYYCPENRELKISALDCGGSSTPCLRLNISPDSFVIESIFFFNSTEIQLKYRRSFNTNICNHDWADDGFPMALPLIESVYGFSNYGNPNASCIYSGIGSIYTPIGELNYPQECLVSFPSSIPDPLILVPHAVSCTNY